MPLDAVIMTALRTELSERIVGTKIDKVQQPEKNMLILSLRGRGDSARLLISANQSGARMHLTDGTFQNPQSPPMFCMLLRKHLQGAIIKEVTQPLMERIIAIELDAYDELGDPGKKRLIFEAMGKNTNIILTDGDGLIIDCLRRVSSDTGSRMLLPGLFYSAPEAMGKPVFFLSSSYERKMLWDSAEGEKNADRWLLDNFSALSPLVCRELCHRCFGETSPRISELPESDKSRFSAAMDALCDTVRDLEYTPYMLERNGVPFDFCFMGISQYGPGAVCVGYPDFSSLLDSFYTEKDKAESIRIKTRSISKTVKTATERLARKLENQRNDLVKTGNRELWKKYGDLITANIYRIKKGDTILLAEDYYSEEPAKIEIRLDPMKTPQQNAAKFYRDYNRAKTAEAHLIEQIDRCETALLYLESVADELSRVENEREIADIRRELEESGHIKGQKSGKKSREKEQSLLRFVSSTGFEILAGRNNIQNEKLTHKTARRNDLWLHAQKIHGSHVVISCQDREPDDKTVEEAASIAAYYSQARSSGKAPVDYTQVRFVRKKAGGGPGMVLYTNYKTVFAQTDGKIIERLKAEK